MNTANPDVLHPLKAYAVIFEAAIGIPHDPKIQELLRAQKIPTRRTLIDTPPFSVEQTLLNHARTQQLVDEFDAGFIEAFRYPERRRSTDPTWHLKTISYAYGLEDGLIHPLEEIMRELNRSQTMVKQYREDALRRVERYLMRRHGIQAEFWSADKTQLVSAVRTSLAP